MPNNPRAGLSVGLVCHSSIILQTSRAKILCDPWLFGSAFNNGWRLRPEPELEKIDLAGLTHIWISHEHPDHFHIPSLKKLVTMIDPERVEILFQETNSTKIFDALKAMGYRRFRQMPHLQPIELDSELTVFVYAHRHLDSALGVLLNGKPRLLDVNDTELSENDAKIIRRKFGSFPILLNQFSIAGFEGHYDDAELERERLKVLNKIVSHHKWLGASITVPFASFLYFCKADNQRLNSYVSSVSDAKRHLEANGCRCAVLRTNSPMIEADADALAQNDEPGFYEAYYLAHPPVIEGIESVSFEDCRKVFRDRTAQWKSRTAKRIYARLAPLTVHIADIGVSALMNFKDCELRQISASQTECAMVINSQPLLQAFATPFGVQTLGVSGRYYFNRKVPSWKLVRIISSLANAGVFLSVRSAASPETLRWIWSRRRGLAGQISQQIARFSK